jgi:hypothetical protein
VQGSAAGLDSAAVSSEESDEQLASTKLVATTIGNSIDVLLWIT